MKKWILLTALLIITPVFATTTTVDVSLLGNITDFDIYAGDNLILFWNTKTITITAHQQDLNLIEILAPAETYYNDGLNLTVIASACPNQTFICPPCPNCTLTCEIPEGFEEIVDYNITKQNNTWLWERYLETKDQLNQSEQTRIQLVQEKDNLLNFKLPQAEEDAKQEGIDETNQRWAWVVIAEMFFGIIIVVFIWAYFKFGWSEGFGKHTMFYEVYDGGHRKKRMKYEQELERKADIYQIGDERINPETHDHIESITPKHRFVLKADKGELDKKFGTQIAELKRTITSKDEIIKGLKEENKDYKERMSKVLDVPEATEEKGKKK